MNKIISVLLPLCLSLCLLGSFLLPAQTTDAQIPVTDVLHVIETVLQYINDLVQTVNDYAQLINSIRALKDLPEDLANVFVFPEVMAGEYAEEFSEQLGGYGAESIPEHPTFAYSSHDYENVYEDLFNLERFPIGDEVYHGREFSYRNQREWENMVANRTRKTLDRSFYNMKSSRGQLVKGIVGLLKIKELMMGGQGNAEQAAKAMAQVQSVLSMFDGEMQLTQQALAQQDQSNQVAANMTSLVMRQRRLATEAYLIELALNNAGPTTTLPLQLRRP